MHLLRFLFLVLLFPVAFPGSIFAVCKRSVSDTSSVAKDSVAIDELVVSRKRNPITMRGDTLIFDVASFYVPEGSKLRSLLKRLPGVDVSADGRIIAQGKEVVRIKLNGKNFFNENKEVAMNSLPTKVVREVKLYEEETEEDRNTGISSGGGEQVLDVVTEPDATQGWLADVLGAGGTQERYQTNLSVTNFNQQWQNLLTVAYDNQPMVFGVGESYLDKMSRSPNVNDVQRLNLNSIVSRCKGPWETTATIYFNDGKSKNETQTFSEYYLPDVHSLTDTEESGEGKNRSLSFSFDVSYKGKKTNWRLSPYLNYSDVNNFSFFESNTRERVFGVKEQPTEEDVYVLNSNTQSHTVELSSFDAGTAAQLNHKLSENGRNIDILANVAFAQNKNESSARSSVYYSLTSSTERQLLESNSPKTSLRGMMRVAYTEVLNDRLKAQLSYGVESDYQKLKKDVDYYYATFLSLKGRQGSSPADTLDQDAKQLRLDHVLKLLFQYKKDAFRMTAGMVVMPQQMFLDYKKAGMEIDTAKVVYSFSPELSFSYSKDSLWNLDVKYASKSKQQDLYYLLPIWENANPLHLFVGNPDLKPDFSHSLSCAFNSLEVENQRQINAGLHAMYSQRSTTTKVVFDRERGVYSTSPVNSSGEWSLSAYGDYITSFKKAPRWTLEYRLGLSCAEEKSLQGVLGTDLNVEDSWSSVYTYGGNSYLAVKYRFRVFEVKPYAYGSCTLYRSDLQKGMDANLLHYGCGVLMHCDYDMGLSWGVDVYRNERRGYWGNEFNGPEWICDAEIAYLFLKSKSLEVKLQGFDLFRQLKNVNQYNTVTARSEFLHKTGVNSYVMLGLAYHFNLFPGR